MNIFFLSLNIRRCARYHFDKHVIKMILELTQLLSTAWHILNPEKASELFEKGLIYKKTHINHPCAIWVRGHINNYNYTLNLAKELCNEWRYRYNHPKNFKHKCEVMLAFLTDNIPTNIPKYNIPITIKNPKGFTLPLPQAVQDCKYKPNKHNVYCCVKAYRKYYMSTHKEHLISWTKYDSETKKRAEIEKPYWFNI